MGTSWPNVKVHMFDQLYGISFIPFCWISWGTTAFLLVMIIYYLEFELWVNVPVHWPCFPSSLPGPHTNTSMIISHPELVSTIPLKDHNFWLSSSWTIPTTPTQPHTYTIYHLSGSPVYLSYYFFLLSLNSLGRGFHCSLGS